MAIFQEYTQAHLTTMHGFLEIVTAFSSRNERSLERLASLYDDSRALQKLIDAAISIHLPDSAIAGKKIMLKPNWVKHSTIESDEICLRTHDNFLLAALTYILKRKPAKVLIGDAPIQGCKWEIMISTAFKEKVRQLSEAHGIPVVVQDFRRTTFDPSLNNPNREINPLTEYVIMDLGKDSYLEPITQRDRQVFRVTDYNPDRFTESHAPGVHKYCITKELFDADIVISLPKVKTHQKAGITAALKNIVGLNGDKDFLPHHRIGGTGYGGDCYPGNNRLRYWSELAMDFANRRQGKWSYWLGQKFSSLLWRLSFPGKEHHLAAGWHGNDTTWRMVMDLNKIVVFGSSDGTLIEHPQRQLFSLCDGIIGGQGDGPLKPEPLALGVVTFTNHSAINDVALAQLMGFQPERIPLLNAAMKTIGEQLYISLNGIKKEMSDFREYAVDTTPPPGWEAYFQKK